MKTSILALATVVLLAIAAPAAAGGYDHIWFDDRYYRAGDLVRGEVGVSTPTPMPVTFQLTRLDGKATMPSAVVRAHVVSEVLPDKAYRWPDGELYFAEYVAEITFRLPALPPGPYAVEIFCFQRCQRVGPWVTGDVVVVGQPPRLRPARSAVPAFAS